MYKTQIHCLLCGIGWKILLKPPNQPTSSTIWSLGDWGRLKCIQTANCGVSLCTEPTIKDSGGENPYCECAVSYFWNAFPEKPSILLDLRVAHPPHSGHPCLAHPGRLRVCGRFLVDEIFLFGQKAWCSRCNANNSQGAAPHFPNVNPPPSLPATLSCPRV